MIWGHTRDEADEDGVLQGDGTSIVPFRTINLASGVATFTVAMDIPVSPSGNLVFANLMVWIDWAHDGTFDELDRVFVNSAFSENGSYSFSVRVPSIAIPGLTYARFRLSQDFSSDPAAPLLDGETEDYAVTLTNVVAVDDSATATEDQPFATRINVLANDTIFAGTKTFGFDTRPAGGTLTRFTNDNLDPSDDQLDYRPKRNFFGIDTFTYILSDRLGNTSTATVTVNVNSVNDAPVNKLPRGPQSTLEDTAKTFSAANRNAFSIADVDAGNANVQVSLSATYGTLAIANAAGVTVSGGGSALVITGTVTQINAALATGLTFNPDASYYGLAAITIETNDLGNSGEPPAGLINPLRDTDTVVINITPVNDAPVNTLPAVLATDKGQPLTITTISLVDVDAASSLVQTTLTVPRNAGTLRLLQTDGLIVIGNNPSQLRFQGTVAAINTALTQGVLFTPRNGVVGITTLSMATNDLGNTGAGGRLQDTDSVVLLVRGDVQARNDSFIVAEDSLGLDNQNLLNILSNDTGRLNATLILKSFTQPANGVVTSEGNALRFIPAANFNGRTTLTYTGRRQRGSATVLIIGKS